jgi:prephenate dehydrogenase
MNDPDGFLAGRHVAIVGLGLMGGSLALGLRGQSAELVAVDPDPATQSLALERGVVDRIAASLEEIVDLVEVIILAAPVGVILEHLSWLSALGNHPLSSITGSQPPLSPVPSLLADKSTPRVIIIDLGSTKQEIVAAMKTLPEQFDPIGGHPMCGKETSGLANADAAIYHGARFAFTPLERTSPRARGFAEALAIQVGAVPLWTDPATHDRWAAATSHVPFLLASALAGVTPPDTAPLVGPGFRSTSRLAAASLPVMLDILKTNRQPVLEALHSFQSQVGEIEKCLAEGDFTGLASLLAAAAQRHQALVQG